MKKRSIFSIAGVLFLIAALALTCYNLLDMRRAEKASAGVLDALLPEVKQDPAPPEGRLLDENNLSEIEFPDYILNPDMDMPVKEMEGREYIGVLRIPVLDNRELPVLSDWSNSLLRIAPCRYEGSAYKNDLIICAHNYAKHFGDLRNLRFGDEVSFTDMEGNVFTYEVVEIQQLDATAVKEMSEGDWDLTLFTCTVGGRYRITVRCDLKKNA